MRDGAPAQQPAILSEQNAVLGGRLRHQLVVVRIVAVGDVLARSRLATLVAQRGERPTQPPRRPVRKRARPDVSVITSDRRNPPYPSAVVRVGAVGEGASQSSRNVDAHRRHINGLANYSARSELRSVRCSRPSAIAGPGVGPLAVPAPMAVA